MSAKRDTKKREVERIIALCYVRQSFTRDAEDMNSLERQKSNIQAVCERNNWKPEWYEDVGGHKSGRSEKNRPQWLALKARISDPDVIALVANDLSRLHRKGWRVGDLIEFLNENDVNLVLAAPGRDVDTTTIKGRMFLQFGAIIDEFYAEDISQRAKDNVAYRKGLGKSIGMPPFGTIRGEDGYLIPSPDGAWLMPDGTFIAGKSDAPPSEEAVWRGYHEAARNVLTLYATGEYGLEKVAYQLSEEGWAFRDRGRIPRPINRDDVRRIVANWVEYGGIILDRNAKSRPGYKSIDFDNLPFREDRVVFPIDLLRKVAQVRQERTRKRTAYSANSVAYSYPLSVITYCAHCEQQAEKMANPALRSRLTGYGAATNDELRYRHKPGIKCGCKNRSVSAEIYEVDFARLIKLLTVRREALDLMTELAIQADKGMTDNDVDLEEEKQTAIALCRRKIEAAINLYGDGRIDRAEYLRRTEANEREIAHWQSRTTETEQLAVELGMCIDAVERLVRLWDISDDDDKQGLARSLFVEIIYDLDKQKIIGFKLKAWADRFLILRTALYEIETEETNDVSQGESNGMLHRRIELLLPP